MFDLTKCISEACPQKETCYRYRVNKSADVRDYYDPKVTDCEFHLICKWVQKAPA